MKKLKQLSEKIKENIDLLIESETEKKSTLELTVLDMKNRVIIAKGLIATAIAEMERLKHAYKDAINAEDVVHERWQKIVDSEITDDDNQKADEVKQNLHRQQQRVNELENQIHLQETVVTELKAKLISYHRQFKTASERAESLTQQQKQAELQAKFYQLFAESENPDDSHAFKQAEIRLKETEAAAELWKERNQKTREKVEKSEKDLNVDEALAALKDEILGSNKND